MKTMGKAMLEFAFQMARNIEAKAVLLYADMVPDQHLPDTVENFQVIVVSRGDKELPSQYEERATVLNVPDVNLTRVGQIKIAIAKGIVMGLFKRGDRLVCLSGIPRFEYLDSLFVIDVGKEFEILTSEDISDIREIGYPEVFGTLLSIALELAAQGREGRRVGTIFVLGDHERVMQLSRQMIINPFMGYRDEERNILNMDLRETIKELSAIDGAFVIQNNGVIVTASRHLSAALESKDFPRGLGSRHIAAAGITSVTDAVAIVVSESTGMVTVLKKGKIFVRIEKPTE
ncbi:MAG: diadenylate cyclase [Syntrophales bacterium]|jgi:DNA integrity scanning protein DisA with diadenylate cyclase activity|nr:diadenylate cyclase [Syntrophales bacterium]